MKNPPHELDDLANLACEAEKEPLLAGFARYCLLHSQGLRRQALGALDEFISHALNTSVSDRIWIATWLLSRVDGLPSRDVIVRQPLQVRFIDPTLEEWRKLAPLDPRPRQWSSDPAHWYEALRLDPTEQVARRKLIEWRLYHINYSTHEIWDGHGYLGNPAEDLAFLIEVDELLKGFTGPEARLRKYQEKTGYYRQKIENYLVAQREQ